MGTGKSLGKPNKLREVTCEGLASRPREVEILLAASCYRNRDKHRQLWASLGSKASLLYKHAHDDVFDDFPKISRPLSENFRRFSKIVPNELFRTFLGHFLKITEDFLGGTDNVSITQQHIWVLLRDYVAIAMVIILVSMAAPISS